MRVVLQRVTHASVEIGGALHSQIGRGLLVLLGIEPVDTQEDADWLVKKIAALRIFDDENGVMNRHVVDGDGQVLVAVPLYKYFVEQMAKTIGKSVETGVFGADMQVSLLNNGPVTITMDTHNKE